MSEDTAHPVYIIIGSVTAEEGGPEIPVHILLTGPDDDSVIRSALNALAHDGYAEADFSQIGTITDQPIEEPHASAYQGAMEGEVAIITLADELGFDGGEFDNDKDERVDGRDADNVHPFEALKGWKPDS